MSIKKHIPNTITCLNLLCGAISIILTFKGLFHQAFMMIILAAVFDFCDGAFARLLNEYSELGKELDSLSDVISFGLAPSFMFFIWYSKVTVHPEVLAYIALLIAPFSALRLAKFNLDERQTKNFIGMPTPICAIFVASIVSYAHLCVANGAQSIVVDLLSSIWFIPVCALILSFLLVCEIPMFSLKSKSFGFKTSPTETLFFLITALCVPVAVIISKVKGLLTITSLIVILAMVAYLAINLLKQISSR